MLDKLMNPDRDGAALKLWSKLCVCLNAHSFVSCVFQGFLWGSIHVLKEEVDHYTLQLKQHGQNDGVVSSVKLSVVLIVMSDYLRVEHEPDFDNVSVFPQCPVTETVLIIWLNNPIRHHNVRGQTVELTFNCKHHEELEEAAGRVFMVPVCLPVCIHRLPSSF